MNCQKISCWFFLLVFICAGACKPSSSVKEKENATIQTPLADENSFMMKMQGKALKEDFIGVTTSSGKEDSLFFIKSTGVSTAPIVTSANEFIQSLDSEQRKKTIFDVQDDEWRKWSNVDNGIFRRQGISIKDMNTKQRQLAFLFIGEALSAKGLKLTKDIMKTDQTLREFNENNPKFDEELYFITIMGSPSKTEPWGWQIDGHHLVINYFILGDQVVMTPTFMGGEPILTTTGKHKGNSLFQDEQNLGLKFMQSLSIDQQEQAILSPNKGHNDAKTEAFKDNAILDYQGINASTLSPQQQQALMQLAQEYISTIREDHAEIKMDELKTQLNKTYFAWIGGTDDASVFYYRIHSPVVLIEFDHQGPIGLKGNREQATRNHIHTVVRTPNGNDYGKDLLKQHLEKHH